MHLLDSQSLQSGKKIQKPQVYERYFSLPVDKYITVHTTSKNAKTYDYFADVISILAPILQKEGIHFLQIGAKEDRPLKNVINICGGSSYGQTAFVIKNSLLHLGVDSFPNHLAGYFDVPVVGLYSNNYLDCVRPFFGDSAKQI